MSRRHGLIATLVAAQRQSERAAARRYRQHLAQQREIEARNLKAQAATAVEMHETHLEMIVTLHHDAASRWDWAQVMASPPPTTTAEREQQARKSLESYHPSFFERLFGGAKRRQAELEAAVAKARALDEAAWREMVEQWNWYQQIAHGIVQGDLRACQAVIDHLGPFEELESIGADVKARVIEHALVEALVTVRDDIVPSVEQKLLASGKLSSKDMPKSKYWGLYQDHVCSAALRVARELFHLLPIGRACVHVGAVRLNTATGHTGRETLLSVEFDRDRLLGLNFGRIDPSDAVQSFRHAMSFKRTSGFAPVQALQPLAQLTSLGDATPSPRR
jgi:hypothetical protein